MRTGIVSVLGVAAALAAGLGFAQRVYKYRDAEDGVWVYTDRQPPAGSVFEEQTVERAGARPEVQLLERESDRGVVLVARNTFYAPVQIGYRLTHMENVSTDTPASGLAVVPARGDAQLLVLERADASAPMSVEYEFRYLPGSPDAEHRPEQPYRLPFALATAYEVSQAFPDTVTHADLGSQHAIDFVMPVGTGVFAARGGTVIEVASDYYEAGLDPENGPRANIVRVLHDDGTMSLYAHLNWNSIRVVPGQRIERGEYVADSGNTGFSSGPHLHFVVQRNRDGALVSVPIEFSGAGGAGIEVRRGDRPIAH